VLKLWGKAKIETAELEVKIEVTIIYNGTLRWYFNLIILEGNGDHEFMSNSIF